MTGAPQLPPFVRHPVERDSWSFLISFCLLYGPAVAEQRRHGLGREARRLVVHGEGGLRGQGVLHLREAFSLVEGMWLKSG